MSSHQEHTQEVGADMLRDMNVTPEETSQFHLLPFKQIRDEDTGVHECTHTHMFIHMCSCIPCSIFTLSFVSIQNVWFKDEEAVWLTGRSPAE